VAGGALGVQALNSAVRGTRLTYGNGISIPCEARQDPGRVSYRGLGSLIRWALQLVGFQWVCTALCAGRAPGCQAEVGAVACLFADQHAVSSASFCAVQGHVLRGTGPRPRGEASPSKRIRPPPASRRPCSQSGVRARRSEPEQGPQWLRAAALQPGRLPRGCGPGAASRTLLRSGVQRDAPPPWLAEQEVADHPQDMVAKGMPLGIALPGKVGSSGVRPSSWCLSFSGPA
jgi:hypothetical protein